MLQRSIAKLIYRLFQGEDEPRPRAQTYPKETEMFDIVSRARNAIAKRNRYNRMVDEINALTPRDLADFNGDRTEMLRAVYKDVYGR